MNGFFRTTTGFALALPRAVRSMRRNSGFFLIAVSSLGVALGLSTAVFAHIDALTHPSIPVRDIGSLYHFAIRGSGLSSQPSGDEIANMVAEIPSLEGVATGSDSHGTIYAGDRGASVDAYAVPLAYFKVLGITPRLGRVFAPAETEESGVAIISDAMWKLIFDDRAQIGNAVISYRGREYAVVGVLPPGLDKIQSSDVWLPRPQHYPRSTIFYGRAKRGVSADRIRADLQVVAGRLAAVHGTGRPSFSVFVRSTTPDPFQLKAYHAAMVGAAVCILIIACGNVSALMLARGVVTRRDQAVRLSLGATRRELLTSVAAEVFVIAVSGGVAGMFLATWLMHIVASLVQKDPASLGIGFAAQWSGRVFAQSFVAMLAAVGLAAMLPAWHAARVDPSEPLKESAGTTTGRAATRFRVLVIAELALSMTLLMGSSLIAKATRNVAKFDFGYDARPLFIASANVNVTSDLAKHTVDSLSAAGKRPQITESQLSAALARVRAINGVAGVSPISGGLPDNGTVSSDESRGRTNALNLRIYLNVGPGFMKTLGVPIVEGRDFVEGDRAGRGGIILDSIASKQLFPNGGAVGRLVKLGDEASKRAWLPVVGIARTAILHFPTDADYEVEPQVYASMPLQPFESTNILVRPNDMRLGTVLATQRVLAEQFPPNAFVHTARWLVGYEAALSARQFTASIFVGLALVSLALAAVGLFSVLSYSVGQRTREFAVRVALGANRNDVLRIVLRDGLLMALGGTAAGAFLGVWAGSLLNHFLWNVSPWDAGALILAEAILIGVTMASCLVPAVRATRSDPLVVLRAT